MRRLTVGIGPGMLDESPNTGAGRIHHSGIPELFPRLARRPGPWRRPDVWLTDASGQEFDPREPVAALCHGAEWLLDPSLEDMVPADFFKPFVARMEQGVRSATVTVVSSEYTREALTAGWGISPERVVVVHYGVDPERFVHRPGGRRLVADKLGQDRPYVLFVGVPSPAKGVRQLRAAMASLAWDGYPHALVIAGPRATLEPAEWREEASRELDGAPGRLCWFENANDDQLVPLYSEADVVCLPSVKESFGLPIVEAMACRAPVLAGNRAALPEVVDDAGLLCEPTDEGVTEGLRRILDDPTLAQALAGKGRARAEQMTWRHTADGWIGALRLATKLRE